MWLHDIEVDSEFVKRSRAMMNEAALAARGATEAFHYASLIYVQDKVCSFIGKEVWMQFATGKQLVKVELPDRGVYPFRIRKKLKSGKYSKRVTAYRWNAVDSIIGLKDKVG